MIRLIGGLMALMLLVACSQPEDRAESGPSSKNIPERSLRINLGGEPETMDPSLNKSLIGSRVLKGVFEPLCRVKSDGEIEPMAAESWEHNDDFTQWTFKLRQDAKWHNGEPVVAEDFRYGLMRAMTPSVGAEYSTMAYNFIKGGKAYYEAEGMDGNMEFTGVKAVDDHTLVIEMENSTPYFLSVLDNSIFLPINRRVVESAEAGQWTMKEETLIGNGAFRMKEYRPKDRAIIEKADTYWNKDKITWNDVTFYFIESLQTELQAFESGDIDITNKVSLGEVSRWKDKPEWREVTNFGTYYIGFQNKVKPFDDARVRKAFSLAIDRKLIIDRVLRRGETLSGGLIPESLPSPKGGYYVDHRGDFIGGQDIEEARRLVAEAGYNEENPLPPLEYIYDTAEDHKLIGEQMQAMWKEAFGVDVRLQPVEWGVRLERGAQGDFMICRNGWYGDYLDAMTFMELFETDSPFNRPRFFNDRYDELVAAARREQDLSKREDLFIEAERILVEEECGIAPMFTYALPILVRTDIEGLERNMFGDMYYHQARRNFSSN